jgi:hypothetical protein
LYTRPRQQYLSPSLSKHHAFRFSGKAELILVLYSFRKTVCKIASLADHYEAAAHVGNKRFVIPWQSGSQRRLLCPESRRRANMSSHYHDVTRSASTHKFLIRFRSRALRLLIFPTGVFSSKS